jgi:hypothetical protein
MRRSNLEPEMWMTFAIVIGVILCCLFVVPFLYGFVTEFFRTRRQGRQPRLRIFDEE